MSDAYRRSAEGGRDEDSEAENQVTVAMEKIAVGNDVGNPVTRA